MVVLNCGIFVQGPVDKQSIPKRGPSVATTSDGAWASSTRYTVSTADSSLAATGPGSARSLFMM